MWQGENGVVVIKEQKTREEVIEQVDSLTCFQDIVSQALHECVVFIRFEGRAILGNDFIEALDAAVAHSL